MAEYRILKPVKKYGDALVIVLGKDDKAITGVKRGDRVTVIIEYAEKGIERVQ